MENNNKYKDASYLNCVHCGKCLPVCPSYNAVLDEFFSPRGRIRLILTDNGGKLPLKASKIFESMSSCLLCGRCVKICPNDVKIGSLVINEKIKLNKYAGNFQPKEKFVLKALKNKRKIILKSALKIANIYPVEKLADGYFPEPEGKSFIRNRDLIFNVSGKNILKAGYFSGCVFNNIYPLVSLDTITALTENGVAVFVPQAQGCCGLPFISSGDVKSFKEFALKNATAFNGENLDYIITSCASCSYSANNLYPLYFDENDEGYSEVIKFSKKLINIWSFFKEAEKIGMEIKSGQLKKETDAVFHIPCHLANAAGFKPSSPNERLIGEAGKIIDKIGGLKLKPLKHNYCCGNGGMLNIKHYNLSKKITKRKFDEIKESSPKEILTSCSGCMFSLKDQKGIFKENEMLPVSHLISVYAESLNNKK